MCSFYYSCTFNMRSIGLAAKSSENMFSSGGISVEDLTTSPRRCAPKMLVQPAAHGAVPDALEINALATAGGAPAGSPHAEPGRQAGGAAQRLRRCASVRCALVQVASPLGRCSPACTHRPAGAGTAGCD